MQFLNVDELRAVCKKLGIATDLKPEMISRILTHCGLIKPAIEQPHVSINEEVPQTVAAVKTPISEDSLMIKGEYRNNAESRAFFKKIIGNHFRFTVFGLDWLKKRWVDLNPPTFREFADMWEQDYDLKKALGQKKIKKIRTDKPEWAYINFVQKMDRTGLSHKQIIAKWKEERQKQVKFVLDFLQIDL